MKYLLFLVSFYFAVPDISAQQKNLQTLNKSIDSIALHQQWAAEIPGLAVGVIVNNRIVFEKAYGVQNLKSPKHLTDQSDFHMASVSKPFVATAILQLADAGKLNLDSTLIHYLPYFKMKDERYKFITLYHILTHSSGIPDVTDYEWNKPQSDDGAAERYVKSFTQQELDFAPGTKFSYSNAAFNILADVISKASGMSFEKYIRKNIFTPAGMINSSFLLGDIPESRRTAPHLIDDSLLESVSSIYPYNRIHAPSSTLHSNLEDMLRWAKLYLNKGANGKHQIMNETTWENMLKPRLQVNQEYSVCLSWFEARIGTKKIYFHSGGDMGYRTFIGFVPSDGVAVVIMGNNSLFNATEPAFTILNNILLHTPVVFPPKPIHLELKKYIMKEGIGKVKEVYYKEKQQHPDKYQFGAASLDILGDWLYDRKYYKQSVEMLTFCTEVEPNVALWYEHVGDAYSAWGQKEKAAEWFRKSLAIDPSKKEIQKKIAALGL